MAVNNPSRVHFFSNKKPCRSTRPEYDVLFRKGKAFERYDPQRHGVWEIARASDGKLVVRLAEEGSGSDLDDSAGGDLDELGGTTFAAESHLRDYLAKDLGQVEAGLTLYQGPDGEIGIEPETTVGVSAGAARTAIEGRGVAFGESSSGDATRLTRSVG
jgi:hypothetical protein